MLLLNTSKALSARMNISKNVSKETKLRLKEELNKSFRIEGSLESLMTHSSLMCQMKRLTWALVKSVKTALSVWEVWDSSKRVSLFVTLQLMLKERLHLKLK